jgi:hypothetical protein
MSSSASTALSCHSYVVSKTAQGIGARSFLILLPENICMLAIFGNELCATPEFGPGLHIEPRSPCGTQYIRKILVVDDPIIYM